MAYKLLSIYDVKKYILISIIVSLLIPSIAFAAGKCEAEITNGPHTDPGVIFGRCWDPTDDDCLCNENADDGCFTKAKSKNHSAEEFDTTCTMKNFFDNLLESSGHSSVGKRNGKRIQMLFFAPNKVYLEQSKRKDYGLQEPKNIKDNANLVSDLEDINKDLEEYGYKPMTPADLARDRFIQGALQSWEMSTFHIPKNVTIKTEDESRAVYIMGYPFFIHSYCIWHDCDDDAIGKHTTDWIDSVEDRFTEVGNHQVHASGGTSRINFMGRMEKKEPFIAMGKDLIFKYSHHEDHFTGYGLHDDITLLKEIYNKKNNVYHKARVPADFTKIKKKIILDGTLNLSGDGYIVFKNIHFVLGEKAAFKINDKTTVVFSECIIEYKDNSNKRPTFILNNIKTKMSGKIEFLDIIPENPAPLYLYFTETRVPKITEETENGTVTKLLRRLTVEVPGDVTFDISKGSISLIGEDPDDLPNPWKLSSSGSHARLTEGTFSKTIECIKSTFRSCNLVRSELNGAKIYHDHLGKELVLDEIDDDRIEEEGIYLKLQFLDGYDPIAFNSESKQFYKIVVREPTLEELLGRTAKEWEMVTNDGKQYVLGCDYEYLKPNVEGTECTCVDESLDFNDVSGNCMPTKDHLEADQILEESFSSDILEDRIVKDCSELNMVPNEHQDQCVDCPDFTIEETQIPLDLQADSDQPDKEQLGKCVPFQCQPDQLYEPHACGEKCIVPNQVPDRSSTETPTECVSCETYQKEGEGDLAGTCIDLNCNEDEIMVPYNHECVKCKINFIAEDMKCVACPVGTNRLGDDNICADADEDSLETQDCESDEDCGDVQACSADGECENIICGEDEIISNHSCVGESNPLECQEDIECDNGYECLSNTCIKTCKINEDCEFHNLVCGADGQCKALACEAPLVPSEHECKDPKALYVVNAEAGQPGGCSLVKSDKSFDLLYSLLFLAFTLLFFRFSKYSKI